MIHSGDRSVTRVFDMLYSAYGPQGWWPGDSQFEIIVGAILTQSTAWHNVSLAIANLKSEGLLDPVALLEAKPERVKALIAPTGFFNVKYQRLRGFLEYLMENDMDFERFLCKPVPDLRNELLKVKGIGPETADSILLYAFDRPLFVVDAYTRRIFSRLGYDWMERSSYEKIQNFFMEELAPDPDVYNEYHALIVTHCKTVCKKNPLCSDCSIKALCMAYPSEDGKTGKGAD